MYTTRTVTLKTNYKFTFLVCNKNFKFMVSKLNNLRTFGQFYITIQYKASFVS